MKNALAKLAIFWSEVSHFRLDFVLLVIISSVHKCVRASLICHVNSSECQVRFC